LPIKIKAKTSGKRQREKERERERKKDRNKWQISWVLSFDPGTNWKRYGKKYIQFNQVVIERPCGQWSTHHSCNSIIHSFIHSQTYSSQLSPAVEKWMLFYGQFFFWGGYRLWRK
jgi:hypothetical protein